MHDGKNILINQPRSSYYIGGAEMISLQHAKHMQALGHHVFYVTINPQSVGLEYSQQYYDTKVVHTEIDFIELDQSERTVNLYTIPPGENRDRWNVESMYFNSSLYDYVAGGDNMFDQMLSYYKLDSLVIPRNKIARSSLYLCGIPSSPNQFMSSYLSMYDDVIAITDETRDYWQDYQREQIPVVPTGVDINRFLPEQKHELYDKVNVTFIGRLIERKGCDLFIKALEVIPDSILRSLQISIVGDGPQYDILAGFAHKISDRVSISFMGLVDNPEDILNKSDACILPSRSGDGLQGALLEAMSSGNIVVASNSKINKKILGDGRGITVDPFDIISLGNAIVEAYHQVGNKEIVEANRKYIATNFSWDKVTKELLKSMGL